LIPLTFAFVVSQRAVGDELVMRRPIAKCSGCGERVFARIVALRSIRERSREG
jgi:hypothetical protein